MLIDYIYSIILTSNWSTSNRCKKKPPKKRLSNKKNQRGSNSGNWIRRDKKRGRSSCKSKQRKKIRLVVDSGNYL